jgi:hypothetical protein
MANRGQYIPTTWNSGAAPGISAAELQRIEDQIEALDVAWITNGELDVGTQLYLNATSGADIRPGGDVSPVLDGGGNLGNAAVSWARLYAFSLYDPEGEPVLDLITGTLPGGDPLDACRFYKDVIPGIDGGHNLGNSAQSWGTLWLFNLKNEVNQTVWDLTGDMWPRGGIAFQGTGSIWMGSAGGSIMVPNGWLGVGDSSNSALLAAASAITTLPAAGFYMKTSSVIAATVLRIWSDVGGTRATRLQIRADGGVQNVTGLYGMFSDSREKENIRPSGPWLDRMRGLEISEWEGDDGRTMFGLVAQQVEPIIPWLVGEDTLDRDGEKIERKTIKHSLLPFVNTAAIQELAERVDALEGRDG